MECQFDTETLRAHVKNVAVSPFTDWKTGTVDVIALSKLGSFVRRAAIQECFPSIASNLKNALKPSTASDTKENELKTSVQVQGFLASCHLILHNASPTRKVLRQMAHVSATSFWTAVGSSSYSLASTLTHHVDEGADDAAAAGTHTSLGSSQVTYVRIDPATRKPTPLDDDFKQSLLKEVNSDLLAEAGLPKMSRMTVPLKLAQVSTATVPSPAETVTAVKNPSAIAADAFVVVAKSSFTIRYSDTDFNGHVNQLMYITFVTDTVRSWLEQAVLPEGDHPSPNKDTDLAEVRIDYVREIRKVGTEVDVFLCAHPSTASVVGGSEKGGENGSPPKHAMWFLVATPDHLSAQGFVVLQDGLLRDKEDVGVETKEETAGEGNDDDDVDAPDHVALVAAPGSKSGRIRNVDGAIQTCEHHGLVFVKSIQNDRILVFACGTEEKVRSRLGGKVGLGSGTKGVFVAMDEARRMVADQPQTSDGDEDASHDDEECFDDVE